MMERARVKQLVEEYVFYMFGESFMTRALERNKKFRVMVAKVLKGEQE